MMTQRQLLHVLLKRAGQVWGKSHQTVSRAKAGCNFLITVRKKHITKRLVVRQGVEVSDAFACAGIALNGLPQFLPIRTQFFLNC